MRMPRMRFTVRRLMILVAVLAVIIAESVDVLFPPQPSAIVLGGTRFLFGTMPQMTSARHVWQIRNEGRVPLELRRAGFSRASIWVDGQKTHPEGTARAVPPGGRAEIVMEWSTRRYVGRFQQGAEFETNDPKRPSFALKVQGIVESEEERGL